MSFAQSIPERDYTKVDSLAKSAIYKGNLTLLVYDLTAAYESKFDKARAIFTWIADNIAYDYKKVNNGKRDTYKCKKKQDCNQVYLEWENKVIDKTLSKKRAICEGYSRLFKRMCDYAGISADVVSGYTKQDKSQIGRMGTLDHTWNWLLIDGEYYYLDVTWAAGSCSLDKKGKLAEFRKNYNDYYWLTPADKFFRDHYPKNQESPYVTVNSKQKYKETPYINPGLIKDIDVLCPDSGIVDAKVGDTIQFVIEYRNNMAWGKIDVYSNINPENKISNRKTSQGTNIGDGKDIPFTEENFVYTFNYVVTEKNIRHLDIYHNQLHLLRFRVNTQNM